MRGKKISQDIGEGESQAERATNLDWRVSNICGQEQHRALYLWPPFPGRHNERQCVLMKSMTRQ